MNFKDALKISEYNVGETVYIHTGEARRTQGKITNIVNIPGYSYPHYVIEVPTAIEPAYYVRCGSSLEMSRTPPKKPVEPEIKIGQKVIDSEYGEGHIVEVINKEIKISFNLKFEKEDFYLDFNWNNDRWISTD